MFSRYVAMRRLKPSHGLPAQAFRSRRPQRARDHGYYGGVYSWDERVHIHNTIGWPDRPVVNLIATWPEPKDNTSCSGALISRKHVLTAGHCVYNKISETIVETNLGGTEVEQSVVASYAYATSIQVYPAVNRTYLPFGFTYATKLRAAPGWVRNVGEMNPQYDYALITLDRNVGDVTQTLPLSVLSDHDISHEYTKFAGYPGDKPDKSMWQSSGDVTETHDTYIEYEDTSKEGASGSAVVGTTYAPNRIIAVNKGIYNYPCISNVTCHAPWGTRITQPRKDLFFNTWIPADTSLPEVDALDSLQNIQWGRVEKLAASTTPCRSFYPITPIITTDGLEVFWVDIAGTHSYGPVRFLKSAGGFGVSNVPAFLAASGQVGAISGPNGWRKLFATGATDKKVYSIERDSSGWKSLEWSLVYGSTVEAAFGGQPIDGSGNLTLAVDGPTVVNNSSTPQNHDVFVHCPDGTVAHHRFVQGEATWWENIGGNSALSIAAVSRTPGWLDVFVLGNDGNIYSKAWDLTQWRPSQAGWWNFGKPSSTSTLSPPVVVSPAAERLDVFVADWSGTALWVKTLASPAPGKPPKWSDWTKLGKTGVSGLGFAQPPAIVFQPPATYQIFAVQSPKATTISPAGWPVVYQTTWTNINNFNVAAASTGSVMLSPPTNWQNLSGSMLDVAAVPAEPNRMFILGRDRQLNLRIRHL